MNLTLTLTLLAFLALGLTAPAPSEAAFDAVMSALLPRDPSTCDECREHRELCLEYGGGHIESSNCDKDCTSYICRKYDCRRCGDEFNCDEANLTGI